MENGKHFGEHLLKSVQKIVHLPQICENVQIFNTVHWFESYGEFTEWTIDKLHWEGPAACAAGLFPLYSDILKLNFLKYYCQSQIPRIIP